MQSLKGSGNLASNFLREEDKMIPVGTFWIIQCLNTVVILTAEFQSI